MIEIGYWDGWKTDFNYRLKARFPDVECFISAREKQRKSNRYIQFSSAYRLGFNTGRANEGIHYEYFNGCLYLHIEDSKLKDIAEFLRQKTRDNEKYIWERNSWGIEGHCYKKDAKIDNEEQLFNELEEMMHLFNPLLVQAMNECQIEQSDAPYTKECIFRNLESDCDEDVFCRPMNIKELMSYNLTIPDYQRDYCWENEQIVSLFESLKDLSETKTTHHLGTIILHKSDDGKLNIIDGQQRLITLTLLLRELGYKEQLPILKQEFRSENAIKHIANTKYVLRELSKRLHTDKCKLANIVAEHIAFSVLVLQKNNLDLAYTFFSNQNSRGVPLTDYDILKAHHLRYINVDVQAEHLAKRWNKLTTEGDGCDNRNNLSITLGTHLYRLRMWMRCNDFDDRAKWKVKKEFSAAPIMSSIPPFGENFSYNEKIQGGAHFFSYSEKFVNSYRDFKQTPQYVALNTYVNWGAHRRYADVIETILFAYYLKFGTQYLSEALYCISGIMADHRYDNRRALMCTILEWANQSKMVLMVDQASSPTFFLAEAVSNIRKSGLDLLENDIRTHFWQCLQKMFDSLDDYTEEVIYHKIIEEYEIRH